MPNPPVRPESDIDFADPVVNRDPYPHLDRIRELAPAVWNAPSHSWFVTSFDDVRAVFSTPADFAQAADMYADIFGGEVLVAVDNPRHQELRGVLAPYLSRRAVDGYAHLARGIIDQYLGPVVERLRSGETVDVAPYLRQIPTRFIASLLGVPHEDSDQFVEWAQRMTAIFDIYDAPDLENAAELRAAALAASKEMHDYSGEALEIRRRTGKTDDMLGVLASTEVPISERDKRAYIVNLIFGSQDTTTTFGKMALLAFAQHPDQRLALKDDRTLMRQALDEVIRCKCPVISDVRVARHSDVQVRGIPIPEGDHVSVVVGAANRDPSRWENPNTFDIFRPEKGNVGFGFGIHSCLGINFARQVAATVMTKILDEAPDYQLAIPADQLDYGRSWLIRGPHSLPLSL
jgi:cytochrome P450